MALRDLLSSPAFWIAILALAGLLLTTRLFRPKPVARQASRDQEPETAADQRPTLFSVDPVHPQFTIFFDHVYSGRRENQLLAYIHLPEALNPVLEDSGALLQGGGFASSPARQPLEPGALVLVVPRLDGFEFEPAFAAVRFSKDWQRARFTFDRVGGADGRQLCAGAVDFYLGTLLVGQTSFAVLADPDATPTRVPGKAESDPYDRIFVSYAHKDAEIVQLLEDAYAALGATYLRDIRFLRSGQNWSDVIHEKIEEASIFQLCWSYNAAQSEYVAREWRHALTLERPHFIRPVYWQKPAPERPRALAHIQFAELPWAAVEISRREGVLRG